MRIRCSCLVLILTLYSVLSFSQETNLIGCDKIPDFDLLDINQKIVAVDSLLEEVKKLKDYKNMANVSYDFAKRIRKNHLKEAIQYTEKAVKILQNASYSDDELLQKSLNNLIRFYYRNQDYYKALKASDVLISILNSESYRLGKTYIIRGHIYRNLGDYSKAIDNHLKSEIIFKSIDNKKELSGVYINFLDLYATLANSTFKTEFFDYYNKHQRLSLKYEIPVKNQIKVFTNLGHFYDTLGEYEKAMRVLNDAFALSESIKDHSYSISILTDIGVTQKKLGLIKEAKTSFYKASNLARDYPKYHDDCFNNIAEIYLLEKKYLKALKYFDKSVKLLIPGYDNSEDTDFKNPVISDLQTVTEKVDLLQYLADKARALQLYGEHSNNNTYLRYALEALSLSDYLIDEVYYESREEFSKLFWRKRGSEIYNNAISICYKLNNPQKAFYFIEKSKALLLLDNINDLKAKLKANIPEDIRDRELKLQVEIGRISKLLLQTKTNLLNSDNLQNNLFVAKEQYMRFVDSLEITFPEYYHYKKAAKTLSLSSIQSALNHNELVLSYSITPNEAYMSRVSKKECKIYKLDNKDLINQISKYASIIKKPFVTKHHQVEFKRESNALFRCLFPFKNDYDFKKKQLIIINDKALKDIPFESFVFNKELPLNEAYLLNISDVRYAYSISSLLRSSNQKSKYPNEFLAVNVSKFQDPTLVSLDEAFSSSSYQSYFKNSKTSKQMTTKDEFLESYGNYRLVHLSTHGGFSNNKPWLEFYDGKLFLEDMYFKNQKVDLITLSACKSSYGEYKEGEGVMSIARGFINSGAKSVYASFWDMDNKAGEEIMTSVYKHIKNGDKKDEALAKAKREYLIANQNTSESAPFYWSGLVLIGDDAKIYSPIKKALPVSLAILLVVFIIIGFVKKI